MPTTVSPTARRAPFVPGAVERWQPAALAIDPWMVLRLCRYRRREAVEPAVEHVADRMAARAAELAAPTALLRVLRVTAADPDRVALGDGGVFTGRAAAALVGPCPLAAVFVLSLGPRLEEEAAARAERRELLEAFLLDTAGWAAIEIAVRALRLALVARARRGGWRVTHRLAPGYGDWPLEEQAVLLRALGDTEGVVALSEHGVLIPFKSITGLFGLMPPVA